MAEFRWDRLHVERIGDQIHVWGLTEPLDENNCSIEWCHLLNPRAVVGMDVSGESELAVAMIHAIGPGTEPDPTALLVIHTGEAHHD